MRTWQFLPQFSVYLQAPLRLPTGPVALREEATGILIVEAILPTYNEVRAAEFGLEPGQKYQPPTRGASAQGRFARWSPAELAILRWHESVKGHLISSAGLPFASTRALVLALKEAYGFKRTAAQFQKKRERLGLQMAK